MQRPPKSRFIFWFLTVTTVMLILADRAVAARRPNVILVMTDDQGYGDVGAHGNSMINTPNLDRLHGQSVRLTDYHVDPTCSPTRSALLTGRYSSRTGVWHTIMGRSLLRADEVTLGDVFGQNGYATAMFGKWHLGDNYPLRPEYRGFQEVLAQLKIGGVEVSEPIEDGATGVTLTAELKAGQTRMETTFTDADGKSRGAFFVYVRRLP